MGDEHSGADAFKCHICSKSFRQKKELFHHLSSPAHKCQTVRCPWCKKHHVFTRVYDLSRHCDGVHFREYSLMPDGFLSVPNCFYLAVYPENYARLTKVTKYDSLLATEARRVLMNHLEMVNAKDSEINKIKEGWKAGLKIADDIEKTDKAVKEVKEAKGKKTKKRKISKENIPPVKKAKDNFEKTKEVYDKMFMSDPLNLNIPMKQKEQVDSTPPLSDVEMDASESNKGSLKVVITRVDEKGVRRLMMAERKDGVLVKEKLVGRPFKQGNIQMNSVAQKVEESKYTKARSGKEESIKKSETKESDKVEVSGDMVRNNEKEVKVVNSSGVESAKDENEVAVHTCENVEGDKVVIENDAMDVLEINRSENVGGNGVIENSEMEVSEVNESVVDENGVLMVKPVNAAEVSEYKVKSGDVGEGGENEIRESKMKDENNNENGEERLNMLEGELELITEYWETKVEPIEDTNTKTKKIRYNDYIIKAKPKKTRERVSKIDGGETIVNGKGDSVEVNRREDEIWRKVKGEVNSEGLEEKEQSVKTDKVHTEETYNITDTNGEEKRANFTRESVDMNSSEDKVVEKIEKHVTFESDSHTIQVVETEGEKYKETALRILAKGAMPMCPPARRQWGPDTLEELPLKNGQVFVWPPKGWINMTSDRRLLTVEMMAMTLEAHFFNEVAPEMSRCYLLDKYKFLLLPGVLPHRKEKGEDAITRARFQNFKFLKEIVAGKTLSFGEVQHLRALETISINQELPLDPSLLMTPLLLKEGPSYLEK